MNEGKKRNGGVKNIPSTPRPNTKPKGTSTMNIDYTRIPKHMQDGVRLYIEQGIPPGSFLYAVLCNEFAEAIIRADPTNYRELHTWAFFLENEIPRMSWGSKEKVNKWIEHNGLSTMYEV